MRVCLGPVALGRPANGAQTHQKDDMVLHIPCGARGSRPSTSVLLFPCPAALLRARTPTPSSSVVGFVLDVRVYVCVRLSGRQLCTQSYTHTREWKSTLERFLSRPHAHSPDHGTKNRLSLRSQLFKQI